MDEQELLAERFEANRGHLRAVAYRMLGSLQRGRRRRAGGLAAAQPRRHRRRREPRRLADHGRRAGLPRHAARAQVAARGAARAARARADRRAATTATIPSTRALLADSVGLALLVVLRDAGAGRAGRVRAARHVRRAVRRDRADRRPLAGRGAAARQPRAPPRAGTPTAAGRRPRAASARSSTPSSPPRAAAISRRCWRCSIPTSCSAPIRRRHAARRGRRAARRGGRGRRLHGPRAGRAGGARRRRRGRRRGAARPAAAGARRHRSPTAGSSPSTRSPIRACSSSTCRCSTSDKPVPGRSGQMLARRHPLRPVAARGAGSSARRPFSRAARSCAATHPLPIEPTVVSGRNRLLHAHQHAAIKALAATRRSSPCRR